MKESFYFPHDYNAHEDDKIIKLRRVLGLEGYGIYWYLVELIAASSEARLRLEDLEDIAFAMHVECERITSVVHDFGLFELNDDFFWSKRLLKFFEKRELKSELARKAAKTRWKHADAMHSQCAPNAIKERKGNKGKEIKDINISSKEDTEQSSEYGKPEINKMLSAIKEMLDLTDFKETQKMQRIYGQHLVNLMAKISREEFRHRFESLSNDPFHRKNMGSLKYIYQQIKGFVNQEPQGYIIS
jgi:hypothetical protein